MLVTILILKFIIYLSIYMFCMYDTFSQPKSTFKVETVATARSPTDCHSFLEPTICWIRYDDTIVAIVYLPRRSKDFLFDDVVYILIRESEMSIDRFIGNQGNVSKVLWSSSMLINIYLYMCYQGTVLYLNERIYIYIYVCIKQSWVVIF